MRGGGAKMVKGEMVKRKRDQGFVSSLTPSLLPVKNSDDPRQRPAEDMVGSENQS